MTERPGAVNHKGNLLTLIGDQLKVGDVAPNFELSNDIFSTATVSLGDSAGKVRLISVVPSLIVRFPNAAGGTSVTACSPESAVTVIGVPVMSMAPMPVRDQMPAWSGSLGSMRKGTL